MLRAQILLPRRKKTILNEDKNKLASRTHQILFSKQMLPSLVTDETFLLVPSAAPKRRFLGCL